ncbi:coenzyme F420-0:L-glutamate ligase [Candidatus Bipolaricaulota bacterium]|nr:coenzyme F420-0:L-glutamate ligase [Candidatus Bipolaricaulota bacterium]
MEEITFNGLENIGLIEEGDDLVQRIVDTCDDEGLEIKDDDVIVITSKVVSMYEGRYVDLSDVDPGLRAKTIAKSTGILPEEVELVLQESEVIASLPVSKFGEDYILQQAENEDRAREALEDLPAMLVTKRNGRLCTNAGVDRSNSPEGKATLLPEEPNESAKEIRERIEKITGKETAVIITDSEVSIRAGETDNAIGCSGINPVESDFGADDLFGTPKFGGVDLKADEIASAAALHFGQTSERVPVVIGRGIDYQKGGRTERDSEMVKKGLREAVLSSLHLDLLKMLPD